MNLSLNQKHIVGSFMTATTLEVEQGKQWYNIARDVCIRIEMEYIHSDVRVSWQCIAAVIAALSPNNKWERNIKDAENVISAFVHGGVEDAMNVKVCTYKKNLAKAVDILNSCHNKYAELLKGPKITEFYYCIIGVDDLCVDGHAYSVWFGERLTMKQVPNIGIKLRKTIKDDYLAATQFINENSDECFTCYQIQAITWVAHKRMHNV